MSVHPGTAKPTNGASVVCACGCGKMPSLANSHQCVRCDHFVFRGFDCFVECEGGNQSIYGNSGVCLACARKWIAEGNKPQDASEKKREYEMFQERSRSQKTQGIVTPNPLAEQPEKVPKKKRTATGANTGSGSAVVKSTAVARPKRAKKSDVAVVNSTFLCRA